MDEITGTPYSIIVVMMPTPTGTWLVWRCSTLCERKGQLLVIPFATGHHINFVRFAKSIQDSWPPFDTRAVLPPLMRGPITVPD
jgi:hypothetical protein